MMKDDWLGRMLAAMDINDPDYYPHLEWWLELDKIRRRRHDKNKIQTAPV